MHMADALVSPPVALGAAVISLTMLGVAASKIRKDTRDNIVPLMGVLGAFVFAAQMINFTIPGTGSSGHIIGGVLLAAILGPWAAYLTIASVLVVQCLIFADGGLMALGCNLLNMGICSTLIAYPLIYKPIAGNSAKKWRIVFASVAACVIGLELGAFLVTLETEMSGVTALPFGEFLSVMGFIHLLIGLGEGLATAVVLSFVAHCQPDLLIHTQTSTNIRTRGSGYRKVLIVIGALALLFGIVFTWIASSNPDGLEWSIARITGLEELAPGTDSVSAAMSSLQNSTSFLPDYSSTWSGIVGCMVVITLVWAVCSVVVSRRRKVNCH